MRKKTHKPQTTPGRQTASLCRKEVAQAIFIFAYEREPTINESERLVLYIDDRDYSDHPGFATLSWTDAIPGEPR